MFPLLGGVDPVQEDKVLNQEGVVIHLPERLLPRQEGLVPHQKAMVLQEDHHHPELLVPQQERLVLLEDVNIHHQKDDSYHQEGPLHQHTGLVIVIL